MGHPFRVHDTLRRSIVPFERVITLALELGRAIHRLAGSRHAHARGAPVARAAIEALGVLRDTLGLLASSPDAFEAEVRRTILPSLGLDEPTVEARVGAREAARARRAWAEADAIRAEPEARGIDVRDAPDGTRWRVRLPARARHGRPELNGT